MLKHSLTCVIQVPLALLMTKIIRNILILSVISALTKLPAQEVSASQSPMSDESTINTTDDRVVKFNEIKADANDPKAQTRTKSQFKLAHYYLDAVFPIEATDEIEAEKWLRLSANGGNLDAARGIIDLYTAKGDSTDKKKLTELLKWKIVINGPLSETETEKYSKATLTAADREAQIWLANHKFVSQKVHEEINAPEAEPEEISFSQIKDLDNYRRNSIPKFLAALNAVFSAPETASPEAWRKYNFEANKLVALKNFTDSLNDAKSLTRNNNRATASPKSTSKVNLDISERNQILIDQALKKMASAKIVIGKSLTRAQLKGGQDYCDALRDFCGVDGVQLNGDDTNY